MILEVQVNSNCLKIFANENVFIPCQMVSNINLLRSKLGNLSRARNSEQFNFNTFVSISARKTYFLEPHKMVSQEIKYMIWRTVDRFLNKFEHSDNSIPFNY